MNDEQTIQLKALVNEQRTNKNVASSSPHSQFLMIVLLSIICSLIPVSNCLDRNGKLIFSVIRFPNDPCVGSGGFNGTCYTASECSAKGTFLPYFWILYFFLSFFDFTFLQRNWVFVTNSSFLSPMYLQPDVANLLYFKLRLFDPTQFIVWNI